MIGQKQKADIVVVGAGPAGSSVARIAAKAGLDVVVVEKQAEIGHHVQCGEAVTKFINRIDGEINLRKSHISAKINGIKIVMPDGAAMSVRRRIPHTEGYIIDRERYDKYLVSKAEKYGAQIRTESPALAPIIRNKRVQGVVVHDKKRGEKYNLYGKIVVAADGVSSLIGKKSGLSVKLRKSDKSICAESRITNVSGFDPEVIELWFIPECALTGYAWVFPKNDNTANVGVGIMSHVAHQKKMNVQDVLNDFVKKRFYKDKPKEILKMNGVVPLGTCSKFVAPGIALAGDAARMVNPITGAGIENSIRAGIMLGKTISNGDFSLKNLNRYEMNYKVFIGEKLKAMRYGRQLLWSIYDLSPNIILSFFRMPMAILDARNEWINMTGGRENQTVLSTGIIGSVMKVHHLLL